MSFDVKEITNESIRLDTNNIINIKRIYIFDCTSYIISESYNLYVCGYNYYGEAGVGYSGQLNTWIKIDIEGINNNVKEIINNNNSSYLITLDNNLYVCGRNNYGQLGVGNTTNVLTWTEINIEGINNNVKEVINDNNSSYLTTLDNNLYVCGYNSDGGLGVGNTTNVLTWTKIDIEDIEDIADIVKEVITNNYYSYLITLDNNLYVCGNNNNGQLGVGNTTDVLTWTKITLTGIINNVKEVIINNYSYSSYLITNDNNLYVCGRNSAGQLGVGNTTDVLIWTKITLTDIINNVKEVINNNGYSYLITNDNNLYVCGSNNFGQLGLGVGNITNVLTWTKIDIIGIIDNVKEVITNNYSSYLITLDDNLYVCGYNYYGQLGIGNTNNVLTWTKIDIEGIINNVKEFINNIYSSYLITNDNNLYVCGYNGNGQLGVGNTTNVLAWTKITLTGIINNVKEVISNNNTYSYLITKDNNLYVCGRNYYGQLGVGNTANVLAWTKIDIEGITDNVKEVIINNNGSSYLITNDKNLYVCGYNGNGQLGLGNTTNVLTWTKITLTGIIDNVKEFIIDICYSSYLITNDNNLYVCGSNTYGQLGVGNTTNVLTWTKITLTGIINNVKEVIINNSGSSYLITNDNNLYVCGYNTQGRLGVGNTTNVLTWTKITLTDIVGNNNNVKEVISNSNSSYLITNDNNLYVCGYNAYGQLGLGNTNNVLTRTKITAVGIIDNVKEVISDYYSSYLITLDNNLYVCGNNNNGQLGVGDTTNILTWTKIDIEGITDNVASLLKININLFALITINKRIFYSGRDMYMRTGMYSYSNTMYTWTEDKAYSKFLFNDIELQNELQNFIINNINFSDMFIYNNMKFLKIGYNLYLINDDGSYTELNGLFNNNNVNTFIINNDNLLMYNENISSGLYSFNFNERVSNNNTETVNNASRHFPSSIQSMDGVLFITE